MEVYQKRVLFKSPGYMLVWNHFAACVTFSQLPKRKKRSVFKSHVGAAFNDGIVVGSLRSSDLFYLSAGYYLALTMAGQGIVPIFPRLNKLWFHISNPKFALSITNSKEEEISEKVFGEMVKTHGVEPKTLEGLLNYYWEYNPDMDESTGVIPLPNKEDSSLTVEPVEGGGEFEIDTNQPGVHVTRAKVPDPKGYIEAALRDEKGFYSKYFSAFKDWMNTHCPDTYYIYELGDPCYLMETNNENLEFLCQIALPWTKGKWNGIRITIHCYKDLADVVREHLHTNKEFVDQITGSSVNWAMNKKKLVSAHIFHDGFDIVNEDEWNDQFDWISEILKRLTFLLNRLSGT